MSLEHCLIKNTKNMGNMRKKLLFFFYLLMFMLLFIFVLPCFFPENPTLDKIVFNIQKTMVGIMVLMVLAVLIKAIIIEKMREKIKKEEEEREKIEFFQHQKKECCYCKDLTYLEYYWIWRKAMENSRRKNFKALKN